VVTVSWYYAQNAEGYRVVTQFGTDVKTTATSIDLVLPTYGDSYWVQVAAYRGTEESAWTSPVYMSVTNPTPPPPIPTNPKAVIFDKYSMYVTASWDAASGADGYLVYSSTNGQDFTTHGTSNLLLLPKYDTSYYFTVRSYKFYNTTQVNSNPTTAVYFSIPKPPPRQPTDVAYTVMDVKLKQIKVTWSEDDVLTEASDIYLSDANGIIDYSLDNTWGYAAFNLPAYATNYYVYVKSYNHLNGVKQYSDPSATITINVKNPKPAPWQWSYNMYSGGPLASTVTYIENSKRYYKGYLMSADEWNAFTKRINDFREYKIGTGQIYTFTTVYPEGTPTKEILNEAAGAINGIPGCSVPYLSIGSTLSASFMNSLRDALNSIT
jgi:hypothetical protein